MMEDQNVNLEYEENEKALIEFFIDSCYAPGMFLKKNTEWTLGTHTEFIIRPQCTQNCKYCYVVQHGKELYPENERPSNDVLLHNIQIYFNTLKAHKIWPTRYELWAGDLFYDGLFWQILDLFYDYFSSIPEEEREEIYEIFGQTEIVVPTNGWGLKTAENQQKFREYLAKFQAIHVDIGISWSTDGLYAWDAREQTTEQLETLQAFYDDMFPFAKEMNFGYHPMIAPENIDHQIENFDWWCQMVEKYDLANTMMRFPYPSFLEVRNGYWTPEQIDKYKEWLRHVWDKKLDLNDNSYEKLTYHLFCGDGREGSLKRAGFYDPCGLHFNDVASEAFMDCNMNSMLRVNIANLSLPICHRVTYPQFLGGYFKVEDDQIVGITPCAGTSSYIQLKVMMPKYHLKCATCSYNPVCIKQCLGSQYETMGEILMQIPCVCDLEKAKVDTLLSLYNESGVLERGLQLNLIKDNRFKNFLVNKSIEGGYADEYTLRKYLENR